MANWRAQICDNAAAVLLDGHRYIGSGSRKTCVNVPQGVSILDCMDEIPLEGAIIRPYVDLNLETLYNVRSDTTSLLYPAHDALLGNPPAVSAVLRTEGCSLIAYLVAPRSTSMEESCAVTSVWDALWFIALDHGARLKHKACTDEHGEVALCDEQDILCVGAPDHGSVAGSDPS